MAGKTNIEDCPLQDKNNLQEDMMAEGLSPLLQKKLLTVSCDNEKWHLQSKEGDASATLCKLMQTLYLGYNITTITYYHICIYIYINRYNRYHICHKK